MKCFESLEKNSSLLTSPATSVSSRLQENYELLKSRYMKIQESKSALEVDINRKSHLNRTLISDMNGMKPEIKRLTRQRDQLKKWLLDHGKTHDFLDNILEGKKDRSGSTHLAVYSCVVLLMVVFGLKTLWRWEGCLGI